ncbi:MAG: arginine-ornithine antiporter [Burkholderiales bacterium]|jgi:arginine:ornithine antiporter/lysine permease|nr:arginine-ornithine antiporter [Burkholderiales bacterium]
MAKKLETTSGVNIKDLSFFALFSLIFGSMMGSGVFDIPQNVAHKAGAIAVLISWVITAIGMLSLGAALVYITRKRPDIQSGIYGYAKHGFGDYVGFNAAWGYGLNALLGNASYLIYIFATLANFSFFKGFKDGTNLSSLIGESVLIWVVFFLIIRGIKEASIVNILITCVKILALFTVVGLFFIGFNWARFKANMTPDLHLGSILTQVKSTMLVTVWDFLGIEAACIYAIRAKNVQDVAKATMLGVVIVLLLDALISILPFGIMASGQISNLATPSTVGVLSAGSYINSALFVRVAVIISVVGALLAWMMLSVNIFYLAAIDKTMPKILAKMNKKNVPSNALMASSILLQIFIVAAFLTNSVYLAMIQLATSLILVPYLLAAIFAFKLVIAERKIDIFSLLKGVVAVLYGFWLIYAGGLKYLAFSTLLYAVGTVFYIIARKEQGKSIFAGKVEICIFTILVLGSVISLYLWLSGYMSLS